MLVLHNWSGFHHVEIESKFSCQLYYSDLLNPGSEWLTCASCDLVEYRLVTPVTMLATELEPSSNLPKRITHTQKMSISVESRVLEYNWLERET